MTDIDLSTVPTEALTEELRKRFEAIRQAQKTLADGFGPMYSTVAVPRRGRPPKHAATGTPKQSTLGREVLRRAQYLRHAKRRGAPKSKIAELQRSLDEAKAAHQRSLGKS